ncbi:DsbA family protein [Glutamicibacter sp. BSL13]
MSSTNPRPSKSERQAGAREKAAQIRAAQEAAEKRKSLFVKLGVVAAVVVVIALVVVLILQNQSGKVADSGTAPKGGNAAGGITLVSDTEFASTSEVNVDVNNAGEAQQGAEPKPRDLKVGAKGEPVNITIYADANCIHCADFEKTYGQQLHQWLADGKVTVEYRMVGYLDRGSATNYSSRAANAMACVADADPSAYLGFVEGVFAHYEQGEMKNAQLAELAKSKGVDVSKCIDDGTFRPFVQYTTAAAQADGIAGTPTIFVQDKEFVLGQDDFVAQVEAAMKANA